MFKLELEKQRNQRSNCQHPLDHQKSKKSSRKTSTFALLTMPKPLTIWLSTNWKILQEMGIPDHRTCFLRNLYSGQEAKVRTRHGTTVVQNWERSMSRLYMSPAYLTSMQSTSSEMPGRIKHKLESRLPGEISITSDVPMIPPLWKKVKKN